MHYITHNNYTVQEYIMFFLHIFDQGSGKKNGYWVTDTNRQSTNIFPFPWLDQEVMILKLQTVGSCWNIGLQVLINEGYKSGRAIGI